MILIAILLFQIIIITVTVKYLVCYYYYTGRYRVSFDRRDLKMSWFVTYLVLAVLYHSPGAGSVTSTIVSGLGQRADVKVLEEGGDCCVLQWRKEREQEMKFIKLRTPQF
jgi:hypothetical protein